MTKLKFIIIFFVVLHAIPFFRLFGVFPTRIFVIIDSFTLIPIIMSNMYWMYVITKQKFTFMDHAVNLYLLISFSSFFLFLQPENPCRPEAFLYGVHLFILPMSLYFAVKILSPIEQRNLLLIIIYLNIFAFITGIYLHYIRPSFYTNYIKDVAFTSSGFEHDWEFFNRMQSYLGSTAIGVIAAVTILLFSLCSKSDKVGIFIIPMIYSAAFLAHQRGGIIVSTIALVYYLLSRNKKIIVKLFSTSIMIIMCLIIFSFFKYADSNLYNNIKSNYTFNNLLAALENRGYMNVLLYIKDFPLGVGLGGTSSAADEVGLTSLGEVTDANYARILVDLGLQGLISFFLVIVIAVLSAWKRKNRIGWILSFGVICLVMVGTNTLDSYYVSHTFWLLLGIVDSKDWEWDLT